MKNLTNWNDLLDIDKTEQLSPDDKECLEELKAVIERFGRERIFGVSLLHKHFDLADDEILLETTDLSTRTLTTRAVPVRDLEGKDIKVTGWRFGGGVVRPMGACASGMYGGHYGYKDD